VIGYYLPGVPFDEAVAFAASSRLNTMLKWHCLRGEKGGSIVYQIGWIKAAATIRCKTKEGWEYAPGPALPKIDTLLRSDRPESDPVKLEDGTMLYLPLVKRAPKRAVFTPGGGGYGEAIDKWALMALQLWADCQVITSDGRSRIQFDCAMADLLATLYACLAKCYYLTHELASDILCLSNIDLVNCMYTIWGYSPKVLGDDGDNSLSSPAATPTASRSPPASSSA
jgi:hypothetical protein